MIYGFFSALILGTATGVFAEKFGFTRNGYLVSVALGVGGAVLLSFGQTLLGLNLGFGRAATAIVGAVVALFLGTMRR